MSSGLECASCGHDFEAHDFGFSFEGTGCQGETQKRDGYVVKMRCTCRAYVPRPREAGPARDLWARAVRERLYGENAAPPRPAPSPAPELVRCGCVIAYVAGFPLGDVWRVMPGYRSIYGAMLIASRACKRCGGWGYPLVITVVPFERPETLQEQIAR